VAVKIADGAGRASELAITAILVRLGALDAAHPVVAGYLDRAVRNWDGLVTGAERPAPGLTG
jgi:L-asparaginase II